MRSARTPTMSVCCSINLTLALSLEQRSKKLTRDAASCSDSVHNRLLMICDRTPLTPISLHCQTTLQCFAMAITSARCDVTNAGPSVLCMCRMCYFLDMTDRCAEEQFVLHCLPSARASASSIGAHFCILSVLTARCTGTDADAAVSLGY
jgi:hypothetical protein